LDGSNLLFSGMLAQGFLDLNLDTNSLGAERSGMLSLPQCMLLAHLNLGWNWIGDEGAGMLAEVLPQCASLAHLNLDNNWIAAIENPMPTEARWSFSARRLTRQPH
jgi:hypothetical protein